MLVLIVQLHILTCKMFSSTIDYIMQRVQRFPQDLNKLLSFNPLHCFAIHFETILILHFRLPVSCLSRTSEDSSLADNSVETSEQGMLILNDLELPALSYVAPITAISRLPEYQLYYELGIIWWPCGKMICQSQKYTRDHWVMRREALLTLRNHFIQPYRALHTPFSEY